MGILTGRWTWPLSKAFDLLPYRFPAQRVHASGAIEAAAARRI